MMKYPKYVLLLQNLDAAQNRYQRRVEALKENRRVFPNKRRSQF